MLKKYLFIVKHMWQLLFNKQPGAITWMAIKQAFYLARTAANVAFTKGINYAVSNNLKRVMLTYPNLIVGSCIERALIAISNPKKDPDNFRYVQYLYAINHTEKLFETVISIILIEGRITREHYLAIEDTVKAHDRWLKDSGQYSKVKNTTNHHASHQTLFIAAGLLDGHWTQQEAFAQLTEACYGKE